MARRKRQLREFNPIVIEPLTFHWHEWIPRVRSCFPRMKAALREHGPVEASREIGRWQREVDDWLRGFDAQRRRSVVDLLRAETEMLFETISPSQGPKPEHGGSEWSDFRQRWYEAIPLATAAMRLGFERADRVVDQMRDLMDYAEGKGWLP